MTDLLSSLVTRTPLLLITSTSVIDDDVKEEKRILGSNLPESFS